MKNSFFVFCYMLILACPCIARDKKPGKAFLEYDEKYAVVLREGLAIGVCADSGFVPKEDPYLRPGTIIEIDGNHLKVLGSSPGIGMSSVTGCNSIVPVFIQKGSILQIDSAAVLHGHFYLSLHTATEIEGNQSHQDGRMNLIFLVRGADSAKAISLLISPWISVLDEKGH